MKRSVLYLLVPVAMLAVGAAFAPAMALGDPAPGAARLDDGDGADAPGESPPCKSKEFKHAIVKKACTEGGQKAAKKAMKGFVNAAKKATGEKITCKTCHSGLSPDYALKPDAHERFEKYAKAIEAAP
ncbi:MAG: hypothetical protein H6746_04980 [Deltaproteobacteria bacterium]|nr:hypothetical protein [Deltaproteobacteria bacterium]